MEKTETKTYLSRVGFKIALPLFIFLFNLILVAPLLAGQYSGLPDSEQPVYLKIFDFVKNSGPNVFWLDFWQGGFPLAKAFSPLLFFSRVFSFVNFGQILRILSALSYALGPVTLYYFVKVITKRRLAGLIAAFSFSFLPTFAALFFPEVLKTSAEYFHAPWHFIVNLFGDTAHSFSLVLLPLLGACFYKTLRNSSFKNIILCALFIALIALVDFITLFSALILLFVLMFSEVLNSRDKSQSRLGVFAICLVIAFGLIAFWYDPGFYAYFFSRGPGFEVSTNLLKAIPYLVLLVPWLIIGIFYIFGFRKHLQAFFIAWGWFTLTFFLAFSYFVFGRSLMPEAHRYLIELNMSFCLILGVAATFFFDWIGRVEGKKHRLAGFFRFLFLFGFLILLVYYSSPFIKNSWSFNQPGELENRAAYQAGVWLENNASLKTGRVYLESGENWFSLGTDFSQIKAPLEKMNYNPVVFALNQKIKSPTDSAFLENAARATNTVYFLFSQGSGQAEAVSAFAQEIENFGGQSLFQADFPARLAGKVKAEKLAELYEIDWELNQEDLEKYVAWGEETEGEVEYVRENSQRHLFKTELKEGEALLVKMNYNRGFKAKSGKDNLKIIKDPLGFMLILPEKTGKQEIVLTYGFSFDRWLGVDITLLTVFFLIIYRFRPKKKLLKRGREEYDIS